MNKAKLQFQTILGYLTIAEGNDFNRYMLNKLKYVLNLYRKKKTFKFNNDS